MTSQRRLPHIYPDDRWLFLTWALHGSLPSSHFPPARKASSSETFTWIDRYLDTARVGPTFLRQEAVATLVIESLFRGEDLNHYRLGAFVIMANHVHVLLLPSVSASLLLKSLKGATAREANRLLHRTGEQFWQRESYDHWVRSETEWNRIAAYIENNPVKAGLVSRVEEYPWSSANARWSGSVHTSVNAARKSACATSTNADACTTSTDACATQHPRILA
jgi:REP element-mobilizing transposase RayT